MLSIICNVSVCGPIEVGANATVIEQLEPEFSVPKQVLFVIENCVPVASATEEIERFPVFVPENVIVRPAELVLMLWFPKLIEPGDGIPQ